MLSKNSIYLGDCLELMKNIPDSSIDCVIDDPPYCVGISSNGVKSSFADFNLKKPFFDELFRETSRVLKGGKTFYTFTDWRTYPFLYPIMRKYFEVRNLLVWQTGIMRPGNWYRFSYELIIFATKGKGHRMFDAGERDIIECRAQKSEVHPNRIHPSQKPVELLERLIRNSTVEGETVLDSFIGSGSTAIAAIRTDRNFIGFELDEKYFDIACDRIQAEGGSLF